MGHIESQHLDLEIRVRIGRQKSFTFRIKMANFERNEMTGGLWSEAIKKTKTLRSYLKIVYVKTGQHGRKVKFDHSFDFWPLYNPRTLQSWRGEVLRLFLGRKRGFCTGDFFGLRKSFFERNPLI